MRKLLITSIVLTFSLVGCNGKSNETKTTNGETQLYNLYGEFSGEEFTAMKEYCSEHAHGSYYGTKCELIETTYGPN